MASDLHPGHHALAQSGVGAGPDEAHERDRQQADRLDHGAQGDEHDADPGSALDRDHETGHDEADHDGVVVRSGHEVHEHQRVHDAEPERLRGVDAAVEREAGDVEGEQRHTGHGQQPERDHREVGLLADERRDAARHREEQWAVRRGRLAPHRIDSVAEPARDRADAVGVRVDAVEHELALGEVGVGVPAEQRRRDQERRDPQGEHPPQPADVAHVAREHVGPDHEPGLQEQGTAEDHRGARDEHAGGVGAQRVHEGDVREPVDGEPPHPQGPDRHHGAGHQAGQGIPQGEGETGVRRREPVVTRID